LERVGTNDTHLFEQLWFSNIVHHAMLSNVVDFAVFDTNNADGVITDAELHLFIIANDRDTPGMGRWTRRVRPPRATVTIDLNAACADERNNHEADFGTLVHENVHTLGAVDLYGRCCYSEGVSLMSCTGNSIWHLDPWHKLRLGWVEPRIAALDGPGSVTLPPPQSRRVDAPVILYDPKVGAEEYFILEFRKPKWASPPNYDRNAYTTGLVLWKVWQKTSNHDAEWLPCPCDPGHDCRILAALGSPDFAFGQGVAWGSDAWTPWLIWHDPARSADPLPVKLHVLPFTSASSSITVEWTSEAWLWVDFAYSGTELGTFSKPFNTLAEAVTAARAGCSIYIKAGSSSERFRISKQLNIKSYGGAATIGR
jgi:M6 family metalloprotease-like protein